MNQHFDDFEDEPYSEEDYEAEGAIGDKDEYGYCPVCGAPGEAVGASVRQWVVCHTDKVKWRLGVGFFGLFQRREKWDQTPGEIKTYREVKPLREAKNADDDEARFKRMMGG